MDGSIILLYVKLPITCYSNGVNRYNKNSTWKMRLDISDDKEWIEMYKSIWKETEEQLNVLLESVLRKDAYINPKSWGGQFKTNFYGTDIPFSTCVKGTTVLKIASIYKQDGKYYTQVFVKECKIIENRGSTKSFLEGFETCPSLES